MIYSVPCRSSHRSSCSVVHARCDADTLIVQKAVESAEVSETVLVSDDTDLLVLLIYHANTQQHNIYFIPEQKRNSKQRSWDIKQVKATSGSFICKHILYIHAFLGSDTTSHPFGI